MSSHERCPVGGVWKLGDAALAQVSSSSPDHGSEGRGPLPITIVQFYRAALKELLFATPQIEVYQGCKYAT
ncbi:hypothetical protein TNCV_1442691 [Trichonephila clavipes]|nr:hypothetical protein TNCV_1442691 [Trichonephila clavipes]